MDLASAHRMATSLVAHHGLRGWRVEFDRAKRRAGICRYADRVIGLSAPLTRLYDEAEVRDTVLHEVAHALAGPAAGHGALWRATARRIGCSGTRCVAEDAPRVAGEWLGTCAAGHTTERHRRPERVASCRHCSPTFDVAHAFEWTHRGRPAPMHPRYAAELERLRGGRPLEGRVPLGAEVTVLAPGRWCGAVGRVVKVGRTRYHLDVGRGVVLTVPMTAVGAPAG